MSIKKILAKYDGEVHYKAVGNKKGLLKMNVDTANLPLSSFFDRTTLTKSGNVLEKRVVEITTLDTVFQNSGSMDGPILLKIDTEGNELCVLEGAKLLLQSTDFVIAEVSIASRFEGSYEFEDLINVMNNNGLSLLSFLHIEHSVKEIRPRFADVVFMRRNR